MARGELFARLGDPVHLLDVADRNRTALDAEPGQGRLGGAELSGRSGLKEKVGDEYGSAGPRVERLDRRSARIAAGMRIAEIPCMRGRR